MGTKTDWIQILVGGIILASLSFLMINVFRMSGTLSAVDAKITSTDNRVNRIAAALPEVRVRIAQEEVSAWIKLAVVTTTPARRDDGRWYRDVHVFDPGDSRALTYRVDLSAEHDSMPFYALFGMAANTDPGFSSLSNLAAWSIDLAEPHPVPSYVDARASFVLRNVQVQEYLGAIERLLNTRPRETHLSKEITDWPSLASALVEYAGQFRSGPS